MSSLLCSTSKTIFKPTFMRSAASHGLVVPYSHDPVTTFERFIPTEQVRELKDVEKQWDFWTCSQTFWTIRPNANGICFVPPGECWVIERMGKFSRVLYTGTHFLIPFIDSIKVVKTTVTIVNGVLAPKVISANGSLVDGYGVFYYKIVDPVRSHYYRSPITNAVSDSETIISEIARDAFTKEIEKLDVIDGLTPEQKISISGVVLNALKEKEKQLGLEFSSFTVRDTYSATMNIIDKLRAYDAPQIDFSTPGHDLPADYWAEVLTPPFFEKKRFGSTKIPKTPAAVTLEWCIPSPPDFHHFNEAPKLTVPPDSELLKKIAA